MSVTITGIKKLERKLKKLVKDSEQELITALTTSALVVEGAAKTKIQRGVATGRVYTRNGVTHQASAPGQPPATDTGALASSITHNVDKQQMTAEIGSNLVYATHLEFGTINMQARPFMTPAYQESKAKIAKEFKKAINDAIKKGIK